MKSFYPILILILLFCRSAVAIQINISQGEMLAIGKRIYHTPGANTCVMCHGEGGKGGVIRESARLDLPRSWKIYQALGGDRARLQDPKNFLVKLDQAHFDLIRLGAIKFNQEIKAKYAHLTLPEKINPLMYGIQQAPTLAEIEKIRRELNSGKNPKLDKEAMQSLVTQSLIAYIKTLEITGKSRVFSQTP